VFRLPAGPQKGVQGAGDQRPGLLFVFDSQHGRLKTDHVAVVCIDQVEISRRAGQRVGHDADIHHFPPLRAFTQARRWARFMWAKSGCTEGAVGLAGKGRDASPIAPAGAASATAPAGFASATARSAASVGSPKTKWPIAGVGRLWAACLAAASALACTDGAAVCFTLAVMAFTSSWALSACMDSSVNTSIRSRRLSPLIPIFCS